MRLDEVFAAACSAEATLEGGGAILVEHTRDVLVLGQRYWYDLRGCGRCLHSVVYGLQDVKDDLLEADIDTDKLDWHATTRTIDLSDCHCKDCQSFRLAYHILPSTLPEKLRFYLYWLPRDVRRWLWLRGLWVRPNCQSIIRGARTLARALWIVLRYRQRFTAIGWLRQLRREVDTGKEWFEEESSEDTAP